MVRYSKRVDMLCIRIPYLFFVAYLIILLLTKRPFATSSSWDADGTPSVTNDLYLWLQFVVFLFVLVITAFCFEEIFRKSSADYIRACKPGVCQAILFRYLRLLGSLELVYLPCVAIAFYQVNQSIRINEQLFHQSAPRVNIWIPLVQCAVAMVFYVTVTLFFLMLLKNRIYLFMIFISYCAFEATVMPYLIGDWVLFRGAFTAPDFFHCFPPNIALMLLLSPIMLAAVLIYGAHVFGAKRVKKKRERICVV